MTDSRPEEQSMEDRRQRIVEMLKLQGKVKVTDLSRFFHISEVTIRNDLSELENEGMLERVHGGAIRSVQSYYKLSFQERMATNEPEKRRIAASIIPMVNDGDTLIINSGTTTLFVAQELVKKRNLTVVTNSLAIAQELGAVNSGSVIILGGNLNPQYQFSHGDDTINQLRKYRADKLILSVDGVSVEEGLTTYHHLEAEVNRQMISRVNRIIIAADHTKIGRIGFARIDGLEGMDVLVTNEGADTEEIQAIRSLGIDVHLV